MTQENLLYLLLFPQQSWLSAFSFSQLSYLYKPLKIHYWSSSSN